MTPSRTTRLPDAAPFAEAQALAAADHAHIWHPFTPMRQWREEQPIVIERAEGAILTDTRGRQYIDGVSSLWCNVHGHRVERIDAAIREQLDRVAHTTLLGLASPPSIELAAKLVALAGANLTTRSLGVEASPNVLNKVFYSDAGATALEVAFKMAVGYWYHSGRPGKKKFIGIRGAYHGDTVGSMSVGYSDLFHRAFASMVFECLWAPAPDACRPPRSLAARRSPDATVQRKANTSNANPPAIAFPSEDQPFNESLRDHCLAELEALLKEHADDVAAVVIEPVMQGAAGMICQPPGYVRGVADLAKRYNVLLIADEVAVGFGRTGAVFACEHDRVTPDILCLAKGLTGGYLPLAVTMTTDAVEQAFCGELSEKKTLYHGHTYTGNPLACAAAIASIDLFDDHSVYPAGLIAHINQSADIIENRLGELRSHPHILDIRQRGIMVGIELCEDRNKAQPFDFSKRTAAALCRTMLNPPAAAPTRPGLIVRPLGDVLVLMPIPGMDHDMLNDMMDIVVHTIKSFRFA